jgi:hypothetical protein
MIYKVKSSIDTISMEIELKAYQAVNKPYKEIFLINYTGFSKEDLNRFSFYWIDPDNTRTKLIKK